MLCWTLFLFYLFIIFIIIYEGLYFQSIPKIQTLTVTVSILDYTTMR
jgi:hypothetical protein